MISMRCDAMRHANVVLYFVLCCVLCGQVVANTVRAMGNIASWLLNPAPLSLALVDEQGRRIPAVCLS